MAAFAGATPAQSVPTPAPAPQAPAKQPNAAPLYRSAVDDLQRAFAAEGGSPELPYEPERSTTAPRFTDPEWGLLVARAELALEGFAQAARLQACDFGPVPEPVEVGPMPILPPLDRLGVLTAARGWQRLETTPGPAVEDALTLLRHSRHLAELPSTLAVEMAIGNERQGLALLQAIALRQVSDAKVLERGRKELAEHANRRADRQGIVASMVADVHRTLAAVAETWRKPDEEPGTTNAVRTFLRQHGDAVVARTKAVADAWLAPFAVAGEFDLQKAAGDLREKTRLALAERNPEAISAESSVWSIESRIDSFAKMFAGMTVPPVGDVLTRDAAARVELAACRAAFEAPATQPGK